MCVAVTPCAMAASLLERTRGMHEDLEVLERAMYRELGDPSTAKLKRPDQIARDQVRGSPLYSRAPCVRSRCMPERFARPFAWPGGRNAA